MSTRNAPRRNCKGDAAPYTSAENTLLLEARALAFTWTDIAKLLGRPSGDAVRRRWLVLQEREQQARQLASLQQRRCMTCGGMFGSEGSHNRMCEPCRENCSENPYEVYEW